MHLFIIVALHFFVTICQQFLLKSILNFNMAEKVIVTSRNKDEENNEPRRVTSVKVVYKNVCVLGLGFFCLFTAFIALQNLQSSIHKDQHLGVVSLSVVYSTFVASCLCLTPGIINKLGLKFSIVASISGYVIYSAANLYPKWWLFIPASAFLGMDFNIYIYINF